MAIGLVPVMGALLTSCDDDDDVKSSEPSIDNVFTDGLPESVGGAKFTTNAKGQVTKIVNESRNYSLEYGSFTPSRAHNFTVLMKVRSIENPDRGSDVYMELNGQGFVTYAYQVDLKGEDEADEWWFEYNNDGQLSRLKRTEGGDDFKISYDKGDITKVYQDEEDGDHREYTFSYTNSENKTVVANKGCIMEFDDMYRVDMDEMGVVYYAGMLGKPAKNLPMGYVRKGIEGKEEYTDDPVVFHWEFNADKLPVKFWDDDNTGEAVTFTWK